MLDRGVIAWPEALTFAPASSQVRVDKPVEPEIGDVGGVGESVAGVEDASTEMLPDQELPDESLTETIEDDPRLSINGCLGVPSDESIVFVDNPRQADLLTRLENEGSYHERKLKRSFEPNGLVMFRGLMQATKTLDRTEDIQSFANSIEEARRKATPESVKSITNPDISRRIKAFTPTETFPSTVSLSDAAFRQRAMAAAPKGAPEYSTGMPLTYQAVAIVESCLAAAKEQVTLEQYLALVRMTTRRLAARMSIPVHMFLPDFKDCTMYCVSWEQSPEACASVVSVRASSLKDCSAVIEAILELDDESLKMAKSILDDTKYTKVTLSEVMYDLRSCQCARPKDWHLRLPPVERVVVMPNDGANEHGATEYISLADIINPILELAEGSASNSERTRSEKTPSGKSSVTPRDSKAHPTITGFVWHNRVGNPFDKRKVTFRGFDKSIVSTTGNEEVIIAKDGSYQLTYLRKITKATTITTDVLTSNQVELIRVRDDGGRVDFLFKE